ncbi:MAG: ribonuclease HI [Bacteroides sp. SM23_62_1]|nr:MAG: ribonuclease HI [Bacteroides sp. SM23_62_1]
MSEGKRIEIFTDGAARGNPGPGGYGIVMKYGNHRKEISQGYRLTTNNRMELLAVIRALEQLTHENSYVVIYSDSKYVCEAVNKGWIFDWERKRFKKKKNPDLWKIFLELYRKHRIEFVWIKGHSDHPENDQCDQLAVAASQNDNLMEDEGYTFDQKLF